MIDDHDDPRGYSDETLEVLRRLAVRAKNNGWSVEDVADVFGVHRDSVYRWLSAHRRRGDE
ncbi:MAG: helix-turn-helix domain-containing protein, partial [Planctomycetia bacterium]